MGSRSRFFSVIFSFVLGLSFQAASATPCPSVVRSLDGLIRRIPESSAESATFYDFNADIRAAQTWRGVKAPQLIQELLPEGVSLIDHALLGASEQGVVKDAGSGEFMSLRLERDGLGTNLGVSRSAVLANADRTIKTFVRPNAKAVIVFMHGGGTRTTGHHVAINLMNHFAPVGVDVVSFDQPWHGEGPRKSFSSPREYFEWVRTWVRDSIGVAGKPIFLAGHSMGGEFADTYMRLYPNDDLIKGVIALSPVIDPAPGSSLREKVARTSARDEAARSETSETPEDRLLLQSLVSQNKLSFTALLFESLFSIQNSWEIPAHQGKDYLPSLYVWGARDWLLVGNERIVDSHIRRLPNAKVIIYGKRYDVVERRDVDVGHIIFDHVKPGTEELEAFADIREFIETVGAVKLSPEKSSSQTDDLLKKVVQTYINNLAFRQFARDHTVHRKVANSARIQEVNARIQVLNDKNDADSQAERARLNELRQGFWIPEDVSGDLGRQWKAELETARAERLRLKAQRDRLKRDLDEVRASLRKNDEALRESLSTITSEAIHQHEAEAKRILESMFVLNSQIEHSINEFYLQRFEAGRKDFEPTVELQALIAQYETLARGYQQVQRQREQIVFEGAFSGAMGLRVRSLYVERFGEAHAGLENPGAGSLLWRERHLRAQLDEVEASMIEFDDVETRLMMSLVDKYSDSLFRYESQSLQNILELPISRWKDYRPFLQDAWSRWQSLWRERPPSAKTSLY